MADPVNDKDPVNAGKYLVQIVWVGLEDEKPTWEPVSAIYANATKYHKMKLKRMLRLNRVAKQVLKHMNGVRL